MHWFAIRIKKKNKQTKKLPVISFYLFKNPLMKEINAISRGKKTHDHDTTESKITFLHIPRTYIKI